MTPSPSETPAPPAKTAPPETSAPPGPPTPPEIPAPPGAETLEDGTDNVTDQAYDPSAHTVDEVLDHLDTLDDTEAQRILDAERAGKGRTGILG